MTYEALLDKWIRKLGRPCTAGEIVHDLRKLDAPNIVRCIDCAKFIENGLPRQGICTSRIGFVPIDGFCEKGERREDGKTD